MLYSLPSHFCNVLKTGTRWKSSKKNKYVKNKFRRAEKQKNLFLSHTFRFSGRTYFVYGFFSHQEVLLPVHESANVSNTCAGRNVGIYLHVSFVLFFSLVNRLLTLLWRQQLLLQIRVDDGVNVSHTSVTHL